MKFHLICDHFARSQASRKLFFPSKNNIYISVLEKATSYVISLRCKNDIEEAFDADTSADDEKRLVKKPAKCTKFSLLSKKAGLLRRIFIPSKSPPSWDSSSGADSLSLSFLINFSPSWWWWWWWWWRKIYQEWGQVL